MSVSYRLAATALAVSLLGSAGPAAAQGTDPGLDPSACRAEVEPNDLPEQAVLLSGELCLAGTLVEQSDQDLYYLDVAPEDGMTTWAFTMRGVPATITSAYLFSFTSPPGVLPLDGLSERFRADSDAHLGTGPVTTQGRLGPGRYLMGVSRGAPGYGQLLTDDRDYELRVVRVGALPPTGDLEPNDDAASSTPLSGAFELAGDLAGSEDHYAWTLSAADADTPWRIDVATSVGAPLNLDLHTGAGEWLLSVPVGPDGTATLHDLGLPAGEYGMALSPAAVQVQPYTLAAAPVLEPDVDREPNDQPDQALALDPATLTTRGRLASDTDVDGHSFTVDERFASTLVDIGLSWSGDATRSLCLFTEADTPLGCAEGVTGAAFRGLMLVQGRYRLAVSGKGDLAAPYELSVRPGAALPPSEDVEPNDDAASANPVAGAFALSGDLSGSTPGTGDVFAWTLSTQDAATTWRLELSGTPGLTTGIELSGPDQASLVSGRTGPDGTARIWDLRLPAGTYGIWISQSGADSPRYVLRAEEETAAEVDPEPNDVPGLALPLDPAALSARGRITTGADVDGYGFEVGEVMAASLIEADLDWPSGREYQLCLATEHGSPIQCRSSRDGIALSGLSLAPGRYLLQVSAQADPDSRYEVSVRSGPPPSPDHEIEPNDLDVAATTWDPTLVMHGTALDGDVDHFRVHVAGVPQVWRLNVSGSGLSAPRWLQPDGAGVGSPAVSDDATTAVIEDLYLVAGDHLLAVRAEGPYELALTPLGQPDLAAEREPNDDPDHSAALGMGATRSGRLPDAGDVDVYRFSLSAPEHVLVHVAPPEGGTIGLEISSAGSSLAQVAAPLLPGGTTVFDGYLPQGDFDLWLRPERVGEGAYSVNVERGDPFVPAGSVPAADLPLTMKLTAAPIEVAAYITDGQRVEGGLTITNTGTVELALDLDSAVSHDDWSVELTISEMVVPAGESQEVPIAVRVPPDAWEGIPVRVTLRARDASGAQNTAFVELVPTRTAPPALPEQAWTVPAELLGGLDVTSAALGAVPTTSHGHEWDLHDGLSIAGLGARGVIQNGPDTFEVDLAGDEPVPVAGMALDPLSVDTFATRPRAFELLLSSDGVDYQPALSGELGPQTVMQYFVLPTPVLASHARLRIDSSWAQMPGMVTLGEWKVIAVPGFAPSTEGIDIADRMRGGHIVWSDPVRLSQYAPEMLDAADASLRYFYPEPGTLARWVVGFADDRAAQVTRLEWVDPAGSVPEGRFTSVEIEASLDSPLGPWRSLGTWSLERAADGSVAPFSLAEPAWARFIRYSGEASADPAAYRELPATLRVVERATDEVYRSILGEWGHTAPRGIYEYLDRAAGPGTGSAAAADAPDAPGTAEEAATLPPDEEIVAQVARGVDEDWYALSIPAGQNTLRLRVGSDRRDSVRLRLQDEAGRAVHLARTDTDELAVSSWIAVVEPGATYRLHVDQPVISVVVAFDTSASIGPWFPALRAAVREFATDVSPGLEAVQLLPFEDPYLLGSWSDQPYQIQGAIDAYVHAGGSSNMLDTLLGASTDLSDREGVRAILVLGDAVGSGIEQRGGELAARLAAVRPVIFAVHLGGTDDPAVSTHIMQDLALTNGGHYQYAASQAAIERAFDRMATWLRRPAAYALSYATSSQEHPPGRIAVVPPGGGAVPIGGGAAVGLVLDTSGSMLKLLNGWSRISWAQDVLVKLVKQVLPEGLPVALRTFKAKKKSCDTVLAVPLAPLDRAAMLEVIDGLVINKTTRTPIGAALTAVAGDLADATGPRIVVLVTDGAETCKGDPAAAVRALHAAGFEATVNIVGFALDDPELKAEMAGWAAEGGGTFVDAQDADSLLAGITAALRAPFRVYDQDGALVAGDVVGGPGAEVPPGVYRVEVLTDPLVTFEGVLVEPGGDVTLTVGEEQ